MTYPNNPLNIPHMTNNVKSAKEQIAELVTGIAIEQWEENNNKLDMIVKWAKLTEEQARALDLSAMPWEQMLVSRGAKHWHEATIYPHAQEHFTEQQLADICYADQHYVDLLIRTKQ